MSQYFHRFRCSVALWQLLRGCLHRTALYLSVSLSLCFCLGAVTSIHLLLSLSFRSFSLPYSLCPYSSMWAYVLPTSWCLSSMSWDSQRDLTNWRWVHFMILDLLRCLLYMTFTCLVCVIFPLFFSCLCLVYFVLFFRIFFKCRLCVMLHISSKHALFSVFSYWAPFFVIYC